MIDFFDPAFRQNPYPTWAKLRAEAPVFKSPVGWLITRHADVARLNKDPRCGRDTRTLRGGGLSVRAGSRSGFQQMLDTMMVHVDGAQHLRIRKLMAYAFTPKAIAQMQATVEQVANALLERMPARGEVELIRSYARPLPVTVICDLLKVPRDDFAQIERWSDAIADQFEMTAGDEHLDAADAAFLAFKDYLGRFVAERRRAPGDGLIDRLIAAEADTEALSSDELLANIIVLLVAGHETTTNLIGNGVLSLLEHPSELALLRARPELGGSAVEELLRFESPVNANARCPSEDLEVGGQHIKKGQLILCMLGAANRDPEVFKEPDRLDLTRDPNPHTSFGGGPHHCIGAHLARLEGRIALARLLERYPALRLVQSQWTERTNLRGLKTLQLAVG